MDAPAVPTSTVPPKPVTEHWYQEHWGPLPAWQWLLGAKLAMTAGIVGYVVWKNK